MENSERVTQILEEMKQNQQRLLEQQTESLALQREHIQLVRTLAHKPGDFHGEGERFQRRGAGMMDKTRQLFLVIIGLLVLLLFYVSWVLLA